MKQDLGKQIVIIDNGFVHVGNCSISDGFLRIDDAKNLRLWGTKQGLGELANGPTGNTIADPIGKILVPIGRVVFFIEVIGGW
jgi:hypothetical protein